MQTPATTVNSIMILFTINITFFVIFVGFRVFSAASELVFRNYLDFFYA